MGMGGDKHHILNFHNILHMPHLHLLHHHHHHPRVHHEELRDVPKGCLAILVGHEGEEQLQRFVVPVMYFNHPLFMQLLKEAEEEYGFDHKGPITIPCHVEEFRNVKVLIDKEQHEHRQVAVQHHQHHQQQHHDHGHSHHHHDGHDQHHHHFLCFKA